MSKETESVKKESKKSLISVAKEVVDADNIQSDGLPPSITFSEVDPNDVIKAAQKEMIGNAFGRLKQNVMDSALLQSERLKREEEAKLASLTSPTNVVRQSSPVPGGLLNSAVLTDRASILDAALKNFESDDAKRKFIDDHPELLSTSPLPFPGISRSQSSPVVQPVTSSSNDVISVINSVSSMLVDQLRAGMEIQRAVTPPMSNSNPHPPVEVANIVQTFKEINDKNTAAFSELFKNMQEQNRASQEAAAKAIAESQSKIIELQIQAVEKDREFLQNRVNQLEEISRSPPQIPISQLRDMIEQARAGGVNVVTDTPEQERIRAANLREDKKLDHQFIKEEKQLEIEMLREQRRMSALGTVTGIIAPLVESKLLSNHKMSTDAASVASRF
jgi:hypothetical protein